MVTRALYKGCGKSSRKVDAWKAYARLASPSLSSQPATRPGQQLDMFDDLCYTPVPRASVTGGTQGLNRSAPKGAPQGPKARNP